MSLKVTLAVPVAIVNSDLTVLSSKEVTGLITGDASSLDLMEIVIAEPNVTRGICRSNF